MNQKVRTSPDDTTSRVELVVRPEQKQAWQESAKRAGMSLSAWLARVADREVHGQHTPVEEW